MLFLESNFSVPISAAKEMSKIQQKTNIMLSALAAIKHIFFRDGWISFIYLSLSSNRLYFLNHILSKDSYVKVNVTNIKRKIQNEEYFLKNIQKSRVPFF